MRYERLLFPALYLLTGTVSSSFWCKLEVGLQGCYTSASGLMRDDLRVAGLVPLVEPYTALGYLHVGGGGETTTPSALQTSGADAIVDWIVIELHGPMPSYALVESRTFLLQRDGDVVGVDGANDTLEFTATGQSYYVSVQHRNHLSARTAIPVIHGHAVNFRDTNVQFYEHTISNPAQVIVQGVGLLWSGDTDGNNRVSYAGSNNDRDPILIRVGSTTPNNPVPGYWREDVNMDGLVKYTGSANDRDPILVNVGSTTPNNVRTGLSVNMTYASEFFANPTTDPEHYGAQWSILNESTQGRVSAYGDFGISDYPSQVTSFTYTQSGMDSTYNYVLDESNGLFCYTQASNGGRGRTVFDVEVMQPDSLYLVSAYRRDWALGVDTLLYRTEVRDSLGIFLFNVVYEQSGISSFLAPVPSGASMGGLANFTNGPEDYSSTLAEMSTALETNFFVLYGAMVDGTWAQYYPLTMGVNQVAEGVGAFQNVLADSPTPSSTPPPPFVPTSPYMGSAGINAPPVVVNYFGEVDIPWQWTGMSGSTVTCVITTSIHYALSVSLTFTSFTGYLTTGTIDYHYDYLACTTIYQHPNYGSCNCGPDAEYDTGPQNLNLNGSYMSNSTPWTNGTTASFSGQVLSNAVWGTFDDSPATGDFPATAGLLLQQVN